MKAPCMTGFAANASMVDKLSLACFMIPKNVRALESLAVAHAPKTCCSVYMGEILRQDFSMRKVYTKGQHRGRGCSTVQARHLVTGQSLLRPAAQAAARRSLGGT